MNPLGGDINRLSFSSHGGKNFAKLIKINRISIVLEYNFLLSNNFLLILHRFSRKVVSKPREQRRFSD